MKSSDLNLLIFLKDLRLLFAQYLRAKKQATPPLIHLASFSLVGSSMY